MLQLLHPPLGERGVRMPVNADEPQLALDDDGYWTTSHARRASLLDATLPRLNAANADFVTSFLAVGGDLPEDDDEAVRHAAELIDVGGITHVLDVRHEAEETLWDFAPEVTYRWCGIDDAGQRVPDAWFEDIVDWTLDALAQPGTRLLTHCHMGINRGPSAGYAVLLGLGWDPVEALAGIRRARPIAHVWYAEDALRWHHRRTGASAARRRAERAAVSAWREAHPLDVVRIIRDLREQQSR